jgi:TetR/AcrR family transcriptional repressor of nem operon
MSRHKEFDTEEVLERAMELFWLKGYEATSLSDLTGCLGIGRGSFYNAFPGGKHEVYLRALDRYRKRWGDRMVEELSGPGPVKPAIRRLLEMMSEQDLGDPERRGCMVVNAATELVPRDPEAERRVIANLARLEDALRAAVVRGQTSGEVPAHKDPSALAHFLMTTVQGLRIVGKATCDRRALEDAIDVAMGTLS